MKMRESNIDRPKMLGDTGARSARIADLQAPHMKALVDFVGSLRQEIGDEAFIPDFDPWDGGVDAEALFLLEAPGAMAVRSGFISRNNPDETAKNFFALSTDAGIPRGRTVIWNIVPWYIGSGSKIRPANTGDIASGSTSLARFLDLLPRLKVIILVGLNAQRAEKSIVSLLPQIHVLKSYHPSPLFVNNAPGNRDLILKVFREAAAILQNKEA
jgi:uracil-DNA glycosylase